ncbi:MAG TPA: 2-succinyl-5-enolpyruvyl-6-hydroxy-3-cyclohexene-1-carboxylic-acid synthase [Bacteroidales bacterium]|nr:2-succinyl-5-enolpyruvyl-6-hydroxy-3-cyclohexene-1-carboxylic-acid synthase [Bacteroidales bacterium]
MEYRVKSTLIQLASILESKGVEVAVLSPGSRNAPLIAALNQCSNIRCLSVVDERSAAYFAIGIAQQTGNIVAIACTSGTAVLNYAPAIAEAYYQQIPLLILTADRPPEWIDQGDGQTIRQHNIYANFIRRSVQLPSHEPQSDDFRYNSRLINEAIDACQYPISGPVHINIPISEPLYSTQTHPVPKSPVMELITPVVSFPVEQLKQLSREWNHAQSRLIITGCMNPDPELNIAINKLAEQPGTVVLTETTSNLFGERLFQHIDRLAEGIADEQDSIFVPDLLVTIGGNIISRKIKNWLQKFRPVKHWCVSSGDFHTDTFLSLTTTIVAKPTPFLKALLPLTEPSQGQYEKVWQHRNAERLQKHNSFLKRCPWSDLKAYEIILSHLPEYSTVQAGNSTPVRYLQLFPLPETVTCFSNRGVSGIDGCVSTAAGAAWASANLTTLLTGDLAFMYDSNGLWNKNLTPNLRIVVMNNGGGNIFRIIEGPDTLPELEEFIETPIVPELKPLVLLHGLEYFCATDQTSLKQSLKAFFSPNLNKPAVLEVKTVNKTSATTLKEYFNYIQS